MIMDKDIKPFGLVTALLSDILFNAFKPEILNMKKTIAIAMGGYSSEYRISINSGNIVYKNLDRDLYEPYRVHILQSEWFVVTKMTPPIQSIKATLQSL